MAVDDDLGAPNCPSCLHPTEAVVAAWWCPACRVVVESDVWRQIAPVSSSRPCWVQFGPHAVKVDAEAVARTGRAVAIRWTMASGAEHRACVWASAVEPR